MYGKKTGKRLLSWVLMLIMALSMLPLNVLADEVGGTGRYVALVDFNTNATAADAGWQDVSTEAGHTAILTAINDLKPDGGTNLDDGLQNANLLFAKSNVQEIDSKNIIALTDGEPTYHMTKDILATPPLEVSATHVLRRSSRQPRIQLHLFAIVELRSTPSALVLPTRK